MMRSARALLLCAAVCVVLVGTARCDDEKPDEDEVVLPFLVGRNPEIVGGMATPTVVLPEDESVIETISVGPGGVLPVDSDSKDASGGSEGPAVDPPLRRYTPGSVGSEDGKVFKGNGWEAQADAGEGEGEGGEQPSAPPPTSTTTSGSDVDLATDDPNDALTNGPTGGAADEDGSPAALPILTMTGARGGSSGSVDKKRRTPKRRTPKPCTCSKAYRPVCGASGKLQANSCVAKCAKDAVRFHCGKRSRATCSRDCKGAAVAACRKACPKKASPVCARNGKLYPNTCHMKCVGQKSLFACGKRRNCARACAGQAGKRGL